MDNASEQSENEESGSDVVQAMTKFGQGSAVAPVVSDLIIKDALDELADGSEIVAVNNGGRQTEIACDGAKHAVNPRTVGTGTEVSWRRWRSECAAEGRKVAVLAQQLGQLPVVEPALVPGFAAAMPCD